VNGGFNFSVDLCNGADAEMTVIDVDAQLQSDVIVIDNNNNVVNLGEIELCDDVEEFIEFRIQGEAPVFLTPDVTYTETIDGQMTFARIEYSGQNSPDSLGAGSLTMELETVPPNPSTDVQVVCSWFSYFDANQRNFYFSEEDITINFESFNSDIQGRMRGSFQGTVNIEGGASDLPIQGTFDFTVK
jgi:hypothetical protein